MVRLQRNNCFHLYASYLLHSYKKMSEQTIKVGRGTLSLYKMFIFFHAFSFFKEYYGSLSLMFLWRKFGIFSLSVGRFIDCELDFMEIFIYKMFQLTGILINQPI